MDILLIFPFFLNLVHPLVTHCCDMQTSSWCEKRKRRYFKETKC